MADEQQSISDDLIDELVTTAVGNIRPVRVYPEWQPIEVKPDGEIAGLLLFPPSDDDAEFFGGRIDIGGFHPCPAPELCGCGGDWDWPWEERGREPGPTHWMPLPPAIVDGTATAALCEDIAVPKDCQARPSPRLHPCNTPLHNPPIALCSVAGACKVSAHVSAPLVRSHISPDPARVGRGDDPHRPSFWRRFFSPKAPCQLCTEARRCDACERDYIEGLIW